MHQRLTTPPPLPQNGTMLEANQSHFHEREQIMDFKDAMKLGGAVVGTLVLGLAAYLFIAPMYNVYSSRMAGEAALARSEAEKKVIVETAKGELEASKILAEAIETVGAAAQKYPEYREQEFIRSFGMALEDGDVKLIFVPTEANIPIIKALD